MKEISSTVDVGAQVQQIINVECRAVFFDPVLLDIKFQCVTHPEQYTALRCATLEHTRLIVYLP